MPTPAPRGRRPTDALARDAASDKTLSQRMFGMAEEAQRRFCAGFIQSWYRARRAAYENFGPLYLLCTCFVTAFEGRPPLHGSINCAQRPGAPARWITLADTTSPAMLANDGGPLEAVLRIIARAQTANRPRIDPLQNSHDFSRKHN
eukprot:2298325-Prymnesium_polylepis.1